MTGVEYRNGTLEETFASSTFILKCHDILINLIPSKKTYGQTIERGDNLLHGTIGTISCCNNGLGSLEVDILV